MKSFALLMAQYKKQSTERLGQFFINHYFSGGAWPELFETADDEKAIFQIQLWLIENGYENELPVNQLEQKGVSK